jgi:hypothetical protein
MKALKVILAVLFCVSILAGCNAETEDVSADLGDNTTRAADTTEKAEITTTAKTSEITAAEIKADETTSAETTAKAETTTAAPEPEEDALPVKIYSAVCNDPLQEINSTSYKGIAYLTSDNKLYFFEGYPSDFKDASSAVLVDTDVRDFTNYMGTVYYVKNDNTLWAFGNNEDGSLGQKTIGKDNAGYEVELDYISFETPVKLLDNIANVYTYKYYDNNRFEHTVGIVCLSLEKKVIEYKGYGKPTRTVLKNAVEFASYYDWKYSYLTEDGEFHTIENDQDTVVADLMIDIVYNPEFMLCVYKGGFYKGYGKRTDIKSFVNADKIILTDDSLWARGRNNKGQLGDGTKIDRTDFVKIADNVMLAGEYFYITNDGKMYEWSEYDAKHTLVNKFTVTNAYAQPYLTWIRTNNDYWYRSSESSGYFRSDSIAQEYYCTGLDLMKAKETEYIG